MGRVGGRGRGGDGRRGTRRAGGRDEARGRRSVGARYRAARRRRRADRLPRAVAAATGLRQPVAERRAEPDDVQRARARQRRGDLSVIL